ncbi:MAG: hypothetical protein ACPGVB_07745, partial [Chitinophagales bacterium]
MFSESWTGNGTNATRLSNWLQGNTNPMDIACMEHPSITGDDILCTDNKTYTLVNNMPCTRNVSWSVSPTSFFGSSTSGTGSVATLKAKNATIQGN